MMVQITVLNHHTTANNVRHATRACAQNGLGLVGPGPQWAVASSWSPRVLGFHGKAALTRLHRGCIVVERP